MGEPKSMDYIAEVEACINAENVKPVATHEDGVDLTTAEPSSTKAPLESAVSRPAFDFNDEDF